jgi:hypothetical protein
MKLTDQLKSLILAYLCETISLADLRRQSASLSMDAGDSKESEALRIANAIVGDFSDVDEGFLSEQQLKQNLAALLYPSPSMASLQEPHDSGSKTGTSTTVAIEPASFVGAGLVMEYA